MENRKIKEIEYYDHEAVQVAEKKREAGSRGGFNPLILGSYKYLYELVGKEAFNKDILDYGCGTGIHLNYLESIGRSVTGIDLSSKSIEIAKKIADEAKILSMDCELLNFGGNSFDAIFDGGTFSSLDLDKALPELFRVLRPNGVLIGIETLGHNPITNLKRRMNRILGKRTGWAADHILRIDDFNKFRRYFKNVDARYFHLISWVVFPFLGLPGGKFLLKITEVLDKLVLKTLPSLKKYSFKVVFILRK